MKADIESILNYADEKYKYIVMRKAGFGEDEFWTLEESEEAARKRVEIETDAYSGELEENDWQFFYGDIHRKKTTDTFDGKIFIRTSVWWSTATDAKKGM